MNPRRSLYAIGSDYVELERLLDDCGGDISDPLVEAEFDRLAGDLLNEEATRLDGMIAFMKQLGMEAAACRSEAEEWAKRRDAKDALRDRIRQMILDHLIRTNRNRVQTQDGLTLAVQKNGGKEPVVVDRDAETVAPDRFCKMLRVVDKDAVRDALESGESLFFARLLPRGCHLRIR